MALIHCPECKNKISSTAKSCPRCGFIETESQKKKRINRELKEISKLAKEWKRDIQSIKDLDAKKEKKLKDDKKKKENQEKILAKQAGLTLEEWRKRRDFKTSLLIIIFIAIIIFTLYNTI